MKYLLKIETIADNKNGEADSVISATAKGGMNGGVFCLDYEYDGSEYRLLMGKDYIISKRLGSTQLTLEFRLGQATLGTIVAGGMRGSMDIYTHELDIVALPNGYKARVRFSQSAAKKDLMTVKKITAVSQK